MNIDPQIRLPLHLQPGICEFHPGHISRPPLPRSFQVPWALVAGTESALANHDTLSQLELGGLGQETGSLVARERPDVSDLWTWPGRKIPRCACFWEASVVETCYIFSRQAGESPGYPFGWFPMGDSSVPWWLDVVGIWHLGDSSTSKSLTPMGHGRSILPLQKALKTCSTDARKLNLGHTTVQPDEIFFGRHGRITKTWPSAISNEKYLKPQAGITTVQSTIISLLNGYSLSRCFWRFDSESHILESQWCLALSSPWCCWWCHHLRDQATLGRPWTSRGFCSQGALPWVPQRLEPAADSGQWISDHCGVKQRVRARLRLPAHCEYKLSWKNIYWNIMFF